MEKLRKVLAVCFVMAFVTALAGAAQAGPIVIKYSHVVAENTPKGQMATKLKELVEQRLAGKVVVEVFPNSQLFDDDKVLSAMLLGDVQLAAPALSKFEKFTKRLQIYDLPFLFRDMPAIDRFQQGPEGQELLNSMTKKGLIGLGYLHNGLKQMTSNVPLRVPADAKGRKFRIMQSDVLAAQFEALDAVPLKAPFSEVFTLLQTKAIDGQENSWSNIYSKKFFEVQPYITETNHGVLDYMLVTSVEFWNSLPTTCAPCSRSASTRPSCTTTRFPTRSPPRTRPRSPNRAGPNHRTDRRRARAVGRAMKPVWKKFEGDIGTDMLEAAVASNKN
jgi:C4-dicarboxylate-binding protein DctP